MTTQRIQHVIAVLREIKSSYPYKNKRTMIRELRIEACKTVTKRANLASPGTVPDACCRQLGLGSMYDFDRLVENWLVNDSLEIRSIILAHTDDADDHKRVNQFFNPVDQTTHVVPENQPKIVVKPESLKETREGYSQKTAKVIPPENESRIFREGKEVYRYHRDRERDSRLSNLAKANRLKVDRLLRCDVCGFSFYETYGELGDGYIEAHHTTPLSYSNEERETKMDEITLVCSNCHRMLHRYRPWLSISELKKILAQK